MANFLAMAALIAPGDEVIFERPAYEPMLASARFLGADIKWVERKAADGFRLDIEQLESIASSRTRLIVLTNLHNPTGALTDEADLRVIGSITERCNAHVLVDEVYLDSAVPPRPTSALIGPQFVVNSLDAVRLFGASGYVTETGIERDLRDSVGGVIFSGTNDIQRNIIAARLRL